MASITAAGRNFSTLASCVLVGTLLVTLSTGACGGDDTATATDASGDETVKLLCDTFTGSGTPCSPVSDQKCFAMCATGGCKCVAGNGGGVWQCSTDESCYPGGPDFDGGPPDDGSVVDTDSGTTADAQPEASSDAGTDAPLTDAGDAGD